MRKRCGALPNRRIAAFVGRPLFSRFRCSSNASGGASSDSGNCRARPAVPTNRTMRSGSRSSNPAFGHAATSKGSQRSSSCAPKYSTSDAYSAATKSSVPPKRARISPACALPMSACIFGRRLVPPAAFRKIRRCLPSAVAWSNSRSVGESPSSSSVPYSSSEQPHVELAALDLIQVERITAPVRGRNVLEQERVEETSHQRVAAQVVAQRRAFLRELTLNAADEDAERLHGVQYTQDYRRPSHRRSRWVRRRRSLRPETVTGGHVSSSSASLTAGRGRLGELKRIWPARNEQACLRGSGRETTGGTAETRDAAGRSSSRYATTPLTISPWTSVRRKFRPWYG